MSPNLPSKEAAERVLGRLTPQQQEIFRLRFGLKDGRSWRLEEVSQKLNLSIEEIRAVERQALAQLRQQKQD